MKRYHIAPERRSFPWGEMSVVVLGERGRGRYEALIPYHASEDAQYLDIAVARSGKPKIVNGKGPDGKWLAFVSGGDVYTRNAYETVYCLPEDKDAICVVAAGHGAWGVTGRVGTYYEFLVVVPDNTFLKVRLTDGVWKIEWYWLYFAEDKVYTVDKDTVGTFCDEMGLTPPPEKLVELVDLAEIANASDCLNPKTVQKKPGGELYSSPLKTQ